MKQSVVKGGALDSNHDVALERDALLALRICKRNAWSKVSLFYKAGGANGWRPIYSSDGFCVAYALSAPVLGPRIGV